MALIHQVYDTDAHFKINHVTRAIKNESSGKNVLIQGDHDSERFTFELPKMIDGHDMSLCNSVRVHYINIDSTDKTLFSEDFYDVEDLQASPEDPEVVICSWLIDRKATKYAGSLAFLVKFRCKDNDGTVAYEWNTARFAGVSVSPGMDNSGAVAEEYSDVLEQWESRITALEQGGGGSAKVSAIDFTNFENGTFKETVNGETITHTVTFDDAGRPSKIDDVVITWG